MTTRRNFIKIIGGGVVFAASAVAGVTAFPPFLPDAAAAWRDPGKGETDIRRKALSYALLAPNPHNMQPWLADLSTPDTVVLSLDTERLLPATDPYGRQIVIGCGAFLELLVLAANAHGADVQIRLWPQGEPDIYLDARPFASVTFSDASPVKDPLFDQILVRRTNREIYDATRVPDANDLGTILSSAELAADLHGNFTNEAGKVAALRDIVWRGWLLEMHTQTTLAESVNVMRIGDRAIAAHRDGLTLAGPMMNLLGASGLITREALLDPNSSANAQGAAMWKKMAECAPAFIWISSNDNSRRTQIAAGRAYARLNLAATALGLSLHPWSMALQEYSEMADLYAEQQAFVGATSAAPVQMLARIGYARAIPPAPRRGLEALLKV